METYEKNHHQLCLLQFNNIFDLKNNERNCRKNCRKLFQLDLEQP